MMKCIIATTLMLASSQVSAFAPQQVQQSRSSTELKASVFDTYPGAINLFRKEFKFDPLKLSETYEPLVPWFRESEIKHGRTAMLAVVGFIVQDFVRLPGDAYSFETVPKTIDAHDTLMAMGPSSPMGQLVLWIGLWDLIVTAPAAYASHQGLRTPGGTYNKSNDVLYRIYPMSRLLIDYMLCLFFIVYLKYIMKKTDYGFEDLLSRKPMKEERVSYLIDSELLNGRLAMIAVGGIATQSIITGHGAPWI